MAVLPSSDCGVPGIRIPPQDTLKLSWQLTSRNQFQKISIWSLNANYSIESKKVIELPETRPIQFGGFSIKLYDDSKHKRSGG
jgi:hypothetical protein